MEDEFGPVTRSWPTPETRDDEVVCHQIVSGSVSLAALVAHMATVAPGVPLEDVDVHPVTVWWLSPSTDDERQRRAERRRCDDQRHAAWKRQREAWERTTYERLREKFEGAADP